MIRSGHQNLLIQVEVKSASRTSPTVRVARHSYNGPAESAGRGGGADGFLIGNADHGKACEQEVSHKT